MPSMTEPRGRITTDVSAAADVLKRGGLVAFPTETVYGLGANALDVDAIARVFEAKGRPRFDPLIVHVTDLAAARQLVTRFPDVAERLACKFWPGPLTLVLPKRDVVPDLVTAGLETVGIRVPDHPLALEMLRAAGVPIAAPSANLFGCVSPTTAQHVAEQLGDRIDLILDGGPCRVGVESTVLQVEPAPPTVLRGGVTVEELEEALGKVVVASADAEVSAPQLAPGRLSQHYAPRTRVKLVADLRTGPSGSDVAAIAFRSAPDGNVYAAVECLSPRGELREAAANIFAALRRLDALGASRIVAELLPEKGLGRAVNDRLCRAAK
jgi:L-threonylcarbamoyladenylate synthase